MQIGPSCCELRCSKRSPSNLDTGTLGFWLTVKLFTPCGCQRSFAHSYQLDSIFRPLNTLHFDCEKFVQLFFFFLIFGETSVY